MNISPLKFVPTLKVDCTFKKTKGNLSYKLPDLGSVPVDSLGIVLLLKEVAF